MRLLFIADQFADVSRTGEESHPGGAELTDAAALEACPWSCETRRTSEVDPATLSEYDAHIIGNFEDASRELISELVRQGKHILFEHDVRICFWNGNFPSAWEELHNKAQRCVCPHLHLRSLYESARGVIFLTARQQQVYRDNPFFHAPRTHVLGSSLMNRDFLDRVRRYRDGERPDIEHDHAIVFSHNEIKGYENARRWCDEHDVDPFVIRDLEPEEVLDELERTRRFVYLPTGLEPAGRMLLESRFLGCDVISNPNAGVCGESWWNLGDAQALEVLEDAPHRFWRIVRACLEAPPLTAGSPLPLGEWSQAVTNAVLRAVELPGASHLGLRRARKRVEQRARSAQLVSLPTDTQ